MQDKLRINFNYETEIEKEFTEEGHISFSFKRCVGMSRCTEQKNMKEFRYKRLIKKPVSEGEKGYNDPEI